MCLSPVTVLNPTKYASIRYRDRFLLQVPCGKCADCQRNKSNEWLFRTYQEFIDCLSSANNYVVFDTLTYDDEHLPSVRDYLFEVLDDVYFDASKLPNFPCFRADDVTKFFKRLRITLTRKYADSVNIRYFVASEYGEIRHRPHYHLLLFVYDVGCNILPLEMSELISKCWSCGRTDGYPYKSASYVLSHNVIRKGVTDADILRSANYVTKYVQKVCTFQKTLDKRIKKIDLILSQPNIRSQSVEFQRFREKIIRSINQFHRQSLGYGASYLSQIDLNQVFRDGYFIMKSSSQVKVPIAIATYYKRKMFSQLVEVNGSKMWIANDLGKKYKAIRDAENLSRLSDKLRCASIVLNKNVDSDILANYVLHQRGRYISDANESTFEQRIMQVTHYPYVTRSDKQHGLFGVSSRYLGNCQSGYNGAVVDCRVRDFISQYVYMDNNHEAILKMLYNVISAEDADKQRYFELQQRLTDLYKSFRQVF